MKVLPAMLVICLLSLGTVACGSSKSHRGAGQAKASSVAVGAGSSSGGGTSTASLTSGAAPFAPAREGLHTRYRNDEDKDYGVPGSTSHYRDLDDSHILPSYGTPVNATTRRAITALVERYYVLARAENGKAACAMLVAKARRVAPIDHGESGLPYLRTAKTCTEILTRVFKHQHSELTAPVHVTNVLISGVVAYALLGSPKMPASYIAVQQVGAGWAVLGILGGPIA